MAPVFSTFSMDAPMRTPLAKTYPAAQTNTAPPPQTPSAPYYYSADDLSMSAFSSPTAGLPTGAEERRPKRGDDDYVRRPPNAFMLFRSCFCSSWKWRKQPQGNLNSMASQQWKALSPEKRATWEALAKEKKKEHETRHPNYKYRP
ncbi:hypothetical protein GGX14DRAFT_510467, partial [Mycena pura]